MSERIVGLPPIITKQSTVLILGSMPSVLSLDQQEYYGNPRNHFWRIIYGVFQKDEDEEYISKIAFIREHSIALWDTIGTCYREGSLDSAIRDEEPNDIPGLIKKYPNLRLIACNGTKAYNTLRKYFSPEDLGEVTVVKLPSSSPIPGRFNKTLPEKIEDWNMILKYLEEK
ncbi:DNA-deoxyinosine glycosylase [Ornithinibacillus xuwenensis]|uniref:DNA-deoxyinosine glycosylase n=1 Tax=Ornithinibacillus xuwenensis TaxID=3144668 RepID=A0ABU9XHQ6_9BACI